MQGVAEGPLEDVFVDFLTENFDLTSRPSEHRTACTDISRSIDQSAPGNLRAQLTAAPQQYVAQPAVPARSESQDTNGKNKERNRLHQRNYQQRKKAEWKRLQAEVAALRQANQRMQSALQKFSSSQVMLSDHATSPTLPLSIAHLPWKAPEVLDRHILKRLMPVWHSGAIGSCTYTAEQAADIHQVASLSSQQMIMLWQPTNPNRSVQGYIMDMMACLRSAGPDLDQSASCHISSLLDEYCCTHFIKATSDLKGHQSLILSSADIAPGFSLEVGHVMQFTQSQKDALFRLRRNYHTQLAVIGRQRRQLLQQLRTLSGGVGASCAELTPSCFSVDEITQQLQGLLTQEQTAFLRFLRIAGHEISTPWQAAVGAVHTPLPYSTDLAAVVNALALEDGQPPAQSFHAAPDVQDADFGVAANAAVDSTASDGPTMHMCASAGMVNRQHTGSLNGAAETGASHTAEASSTAAACTELTAKALQVVSSLVTENLTPQSIFGTTNTADPLTPQSMFGARDTADRTD